MNDVALFLGEVIIVRCPDVNWAFFDKSASDLGFQRHVLMGFSGVSNPKYYIDIDYLLATYGHRIIAGQEVERDAFLQWVHTAAQKAWPPYREN